MIETILGIATTGMIALSYYLQLKFDYETENNLL